ncbi:PD-(D/E)XK nuclease superfamily protein [Shewanella halifaxensis]|uniref:PD-(D/E)XK nuclease superfamily protein n=1 Tax=Shewanella halifaxensis TaxID=271098 RepID=UPI000D5A0E2D|nr:PD-(D/E)XK nuclease superfamily protein [Shewanella halifaxensis]
MSQQSLFNDLPEIEANRADAPHVSNTRFCSVLEDSLLTMGYQATVERHPIAGSFIKGAPYKDMYGNMRKAAFLVHHKTKGLIRIEAHRQEQSGSVDQKFPFFLESLKKAPESKLVLVFDGQGYKRQAYDWLEQTASKVSYKDIKVFDDYLSVMEWLK